MQHLNHALSNLRQLTGLQTLDFDESGNLTLLFNDDHQINFHRVDEFSFEIWAKLDIPRSFGDAGVMRSLLEANYLGARTGAGRVALSGDGDVTLCERIDVRPLDDQTLLDKISTFARAAAAWKSEDRTQAERLETERHVVEEFSMIRV